MENFHTAKHCPVSESFQRTGKPSSSSDGDSHDGGKSSIENLSATFQQWETRVITNTTVIPGCPRFSSYTRNCTYASSTDTHTRIVALLRRAIAAERRERGSRDRSCGTGNPALRLSI
ncbi:hypothetical protein K0M31_019742 [Melipona bicolor]|uniref:Uncharacterized protein n=1 Tax=Melipona bicolor TaxID=60889 RepID=A0AA40G2W1_9HYME|nr:hypothetical protein K0M31_019742 [Melipona bicolor]